MKRTESVERDAWLYKVQEVGIVRNNLGRIETVYRDVKGALPSGRMTPQELFPYLHKKIVEHEKNQRALEAAMRPSEGDKMCPSCRCPAHYCRCEAVACAGMLGTFGYYATRGVVDLCLWVYFVGGLTIGSRALATLEYFSPTAARMVVKGLIRRQIPSRFREMSDVVRGLIIGSVIVALVSYLRAFFSEKEEPKEACGGIWAKKDDEFEVPKTTVNDGGESIEKTVAKSMLTIVISAKGDRPRRLCAVSLGDGNILTTGHIFHPDFSEWMCAVRYEPKALVSGECIFRIERSNLTFLPGTDLVVIRSAYNVPRRALSKYLAEVPSEFRGNMRILSRGEDGVFAVENGNIFDYGPGRYRSDHSLHEVSRVAYFTRDKGMTERGDCGSIILANSARGWYVHSVVSAGGSSGVGIALPLCNKMLQSIKPLFSPGDDLSYFAAGNQSTGVFAPEAPAAMFDWTDGGWAEKKGAFPGRSHPRTRVLPTKHADEIQAVLPEAGKYGAPKMKAELTEEGWKNPWVLNCNKQLRPATGLPEAETVAAADALIADLLSKKDWLKDVRPVSTDVAINGIPGNEYVNALPMGTSAGFPRPGPKRAVFERNEEQKWVPGAMIQERLHTLRSKYLSGERACVLMQGHLKDEPVPQAKIDAFKTRVFTGCGVDLSIVMREQFVTVAEAIMRNNFHTECAVGMNCYSEAWEKLFEYLSEGGTLDDRVLAGDFSAFDKRMPAVALFQAFRVLTALCEATGAFTQDDLLIQRGIATDMSYPFVSYNGDVAMFYGGNSSGHTMTVMINSIVNSIYMRVAFARLTELSPREFRRHVNLITLGDDNFMTSKHDAFNHMGVTKVLASFGIVYTMPDKESDSVPFVNIHSTDFLKRMFVRFEGKIIAPLELESTFKSLLCFQERGNITEAEQTAQAYLAARREWSLHGPEVFERLVSLIDPIFRADTAISGCFLKQHSYDWRQTFTWVTGGDEPLEVESDEEFYACDGTPRYLRAMTGLRRAQIEQASEEAAEQRRLFEERQQREARETEEALERYEERLTIRHENENRDVKMREVHLMMDLEWLDHLQHLEYRRRMDRMIGFSRSRSWAEEEDAGYTALPDLPPLPPLGYLEGDVVGDSASLPSLGVVGREDDSFEWYEETI